jgi:hypothetical protein
MRAEVISEPSQSSGQFSFLDRAASICVPVSKDAVKHENVTIDITEYAPLPILDVLVQADEFIEPDCPAPIRILFPAVSICTLEYDNRRTNIFISILMVSRSNSEMTYMRLTFLT